jgi:hypothetical protein
VSPPQTYIDDLEAFLEKVIGLIWQMMLDAILRGLIGLVDMNSFSWPTELGGSVSGISSCTTDCVIKNEDTSCSSTV